jgi:pimeloyl-ACP methyl ester carboxylesterase
VELYFEHWGTTGPPVVCLHGLFGSASNWRSVARRLAGSYRVYATDQRGHGRSPHATPLDYPALAEDLRGFLEKHHLAPASVIGHSMGGKAAMTLATRNPELVSRLVVVDIAPTTRASDQRAVLDALLATDPTSCRSRQEVDAMLAGRIADPRVRQFLLTNLVRNDGGTFAWRLDLSGIDAWFEQLMGAVPTEGTYAGPTLFVRGADSNAIRDEDVPLIARKFPASRIATIEKAGHWVHADAPDPFFELVHAFLSQPTGSD